MQLVNLKNDRMKMLSTGMPEDSLLTGHETRSGVDTSSSSIKFFAIEGEINGSLVERAQNFINNLAVYDSVHILVSSPGGFCGSALLVAAMFRNISNKIKVTFLGINMSAALLMACLGDVRVLEGSVLMAHPVSFTFEGELSNIAKQYAASSFFSTSLWQLWYEEALRNLGFDVMQIEEARKGEIWLTV